MARGALAPSGIGLEELADLSGSGDFEDNSGLVDRLVTEGESAWESACEAVRRMGRIVGYGNHSEAEADYEPDPENEDNEDNIARVDARHQVTTAVHLFQAEGGAREFIRWYQQVRPWIGENPRPKAQTLPGGGQDGVLVSSNTQFGRESVALIRRGTLVAEAAVIGPADEPAPADAAKLASRLAQRIDSTGHDPPDFDVSHVMSALMPVSGWGPDYAHRTWREHSLGWSGGCEACEEDVSDSGISYDATYGAKWGFAYVATQITLYPDVAEALVALDAIADRSRDSPEAQVFEVPGVAGAVGIQRWNDTGLEENSGYLWEVYFPHDRSLGRVVIDYAATDQASQEADQHTIIQVAQLWSTRLDTVLGE